MIDDGARVLASAVEQRWADYRLKFSLCRQEFSEEAVHDLRVAARRLLAVLDIVSAADISRTARKVRRFFKRQLDQLDDLRDAQVMLLEVAQYLPRLPELVLFLPSLQKRERSLLRAARQRSQELQLLTLDKRLHQVSMALVAQPGGPAGAADPLLPVDRCFAAVAKASSDLRERDPYAIHRLRIAFKKFRYMAEVVVPLLPSPPEEYFKRMHDFQGLMGGVHDTAVLLDALVSLAGDNALDVDLRTVRRYFEKRLDSQVTTFLERQGGFRSFWRAAPDQPFPWAGADDRDRVTSVPGPR